MRKKENKEKHEKIYSKRKKGIEKETRYRCYILSNRKTARNKEKTEKGRGERIERMTPCSCFVLSIGKDKQF